MAKYQRVPTLSRRQFVQAAATLAATGVGLPTLRSSANHPLIDNLGLQLATVREPLAAQPQQTIEAIQRAGYRQVELFDTQWLPQLQPIFQGMGIAVNSSHFLPPLITGNWAPLVAFGVRRPPASYTFEAMVAQAAEYGLKHLVFPLTFPQDRGGIATYQALAEKLNRAGEECRRSGIQLSYHHHAFEFQGMEDTSPLQVLLNNTDPELMQLQVDVFWASVAGLDPARFIRDQGERVSLVHLKDQKAEMPKTFLDGTIPDDSFQPVGSGVLDFNTIVQAAEAVGALHCFVAQDKSSSPLEDIQRSSSYLKNLFD